MQVVRSEKQETKVYPKATGLLETRWKKDDNGFPVINYVQDTRFNALDIQFEVKIENKWVDHSHRIFVSREVDTVRDFDLNVDQPVYLAPNGRNIVSARLVDANTMTFHPPFFNQNDDLIQQAQPACKGMNELCRLLSYTKKVYVMYNEEFLNIADGKLDGLKDFIKNTLFVVSDSFKGLYYLEKNSRGNIYNRLAVMDNRGWNTLLCRIDEKLGSDLGHPVVKAMDYFPKKKVLLGLYEEKANGLTPVSFDLMKHMHLFEEKVVEKQPKVSELPF